MVPMEACYINNFARPHSRLYAVQYEVPRIVKLVPIKRHRTRLSLCGCPIIHHLGLVYEIMIAYYLESLGSMSNYGTSLERRYKMDEASVSRANHR